MLIYDVIGAVMVAITIVQRAWQGIAQQNPGNTSSGASSAKQ